MNRRQAIRAIGVGAPLLYAASPARAALCAGPGVIELGTGRIEDDLVIDTGQTLIGQGVGATSVRSITTAGFAALWATNDAAGPTEWAVRHLTVDGSPGHGIAAYGCNFVLEDLMIAHCGLDGIFSRWSTVLGANTPHQMESHVTRVKSHDNGRIGINWDGPHDTAFDAVQAFLNADDGILLGPRGGGCQLVNVHSWGVLQRYAWELVASGCQLVNCVGEGAREAQVRLLGNDTVIRGGTWRGFPGIVAQNRGIVIGQPGNPVIGSDLDTNVMNCDQGAFVFDGDGGSRIVGSVYHPFATNVLVGTRHATTLIDLWDPAHNRVIRRAPVIAAG